MNKPRHRSIFQNLFPCLSSKIEVKRSSSSDEPIIENDLMPVQRNEKREVLSTFGSVKDHLDNTYFELVMDNARSIGIQGVPAFNRPLPEDLDVEANRFSFARRCSHACSLSIMTKQTHFSWHGLVPTRASRASWPGLPF